MDLMHPIISRIKIKCHKYKDKNNNNKKLIIIN